MSKLIQLHLLNIYNVVCFNNQFLNKNCQEKKNPYLMYQNLNLLTVIL